MLYALNENNEKIEPVSKSKALCPFCKTTVIACTGEIKNKYWRHEKNAPRNCIAAKYENEGAWHSTWKRMFGAEFAEVYQTIGNQSRKADVKLTNGLVIEIQHSPIDTREIQARERFHKKMVWIFDATGPYAAGRIKFENDYFFWEQPRLSITKCNCPVFIEADFGVLLEIKSFEIKKFYEKDWHTFRKTAFIGQCTILDRSDFKKRMIYADIALKDKNISIIKSFKDQFQQIPPITQLCLF